MVSFAVCFKPLLGGMRNTNNVDKGGGATLGCGDDNRDNVDDDADDVVKTSVKQFTRILVRKTDMSLRTSRSVWLPIFWLCIYLDGITHERRDGQWNRWMGRRTFGVSYRRIPIKHMFILSNGTPVFK